MGNCNNFGAIHSIEQFNTNMATPQEKRKAVREAIDGVLEQVRDHIYEFIVLVVGKVEGKHHVYNHFQQYKCIYPSLMLQIHELETLISDFNGENPALHAKL